MFTDIATTFLHDHGGITDHRIYLIEEDSERRWLLDSGANLGTLKPTAEERKHPDNTDLRAANGGRINTYGTRDMTVKIEGFEPFVYTFVLADTGFNILGSDIIKKLGLLIDLKNGCLRNPMSNYSPIISFSLTPVSPVPQCAVINDSNPYLEILRSFPELLSYSFKDRPVKHSVQHFIEFKGRPVYAPSRRVSPEKDLIIREKINEYLDQGLVRPSNSNFASPLHLVPKPDGGWRVTIDYRQLNAGTTPDRYHLPHVQDFANLLQGCTVFSCLDLTSGYYNIPMNPDDIPKTAMNTTIGLFEWLRMPQGLSNACQTMQRFMDTILRPLPFAMAYIDDVMVFSKTPELHREHLKQVCQVLNDNGLIVNEKKCQLGLPEVTFLGNKVSCAGLAPMPDKLAAIRDYNTPSTVNELRRFLGVINFYHRFVPHLAESTATLNDMLVGKEKDLLQWSEKGHQAFNECKSKLLSAAVLKFPVMGAPLRLVTDASDLALGGVVEQCVNKAWQPLGFYSAKLNARERRWSTFDRELLGIVRAVFHFRHFLEGQVFHVLTDHKPIQDALHKNSPTRSAKQERFLSLISEFTNDIRALPGDANAVADFLSRIPEAPEEQDIHEKLYVPDFMIPPPAPEAPSPSLPEAVPETPCEDVPDITAIGLETQDPIYQELHRAQVLDPLTAPYFQNTTTRHKYWKLTKIQGHDLVCDVRQGYKRPLVPESMTRHVFDKVHNLIHPGIRRTKSLIRRHFVWPAMSKDIQVWAKGCGTCQQVRYGKHFHKEMVSFAPPSERFEHLHIDLVGKLPLDQGYKYILTCIDRFSRYPWAIPITDMSAETVARAFLHGVVAHVGCPKRLTSDRGGCFTSDLWSKLMETLGIEHITTTAYHPQSDGQLERLHSHLKCAVKAIGSEEDWVDRLPLVLLVLRNSVMEDTGHTPAEYVYGHNSALPGLAFNYEEPRLADNLHPATFLKAFKEGVKKLRYSQPRWVQHARPQKELPPDLQRCSRVWIRRHSPEPLQRPYEKLSEVLERSPEFFKVRLPNGKIDTINTERVKAAWTIPELLNDFSDPQLTPPTPTAASATPPQPTTTRSGRTIKIPQKLLNCVQQADISPNRHSSYISAIGVT